MHHFLVNFIQIDVGIALQVVLLGFIGGVLSGFIGSGGAFFMTPGMMNLGVEGVVAVASNITHKFGKAMVGSRKRSGQGRWGQSLYQPGFCLHPFGRGPVHAARCASAFGRG